MIVFIEGSAPWTLFQEMVQLFHYAGRVELIECGERARCVRLLHESGCVILKQAVDALQHHVEFQPNGRRTSLTQNPLGDIAEKSVNAVVPASINRKLKLGKPAANSEILDRFRCLIVKSVDHATLGRARSSVGANFNRDLLALLVRATSSNLERPKSNGWNVANGDDSVDWSHYHAPESGEALRSLYWSSRQTLRNQLSRLLLYLASPLQNEQTIHFVVRTLHEDPHHEELLKLIASNNFA